MANATNISDGCLYLHRCYPGWLGPGGGSTRSMLISGIRGHFRAWRPGRRDPWCGSRIVEAVCQVSPESLPLVFGQSSPLVFGKSLPEVFTQTLPPGRAAISWNCQAIAGHQLLLRGITCGKIISPPNKTGTVLSNALFSTFSFGVKKPGFSCSVVKVRAKGWQSPPVRCVYGFGHGNWRHG